MFEILSERSPDVNKILNQRYKYLCFQSFIHYILFFFPNFLVSSFCCVMGKGIF